MGKHKKLLKSEKAKVKLKGNKLAKGQNTTKTDFRVKKIIIRDQISESLIDNVKRIHNLKETLSKLKHHNSSIRLDALRTLKGQISDGLNNINLSLGTVMQSLSALCLDEEKDIRRESFKIMSILFAIISQACLEPYVDVMLSYLSCAMTHIQQNIQDDSLLMLDVLLKYQPKLVAVYSDKIFNNFLDMISKVTNSQNRSLITSMGKKLSTVKWRSKILQRLKELLKTIAEANDINNQMNKNMNDCTHLFISTQPMHFALHRRLPVNYSTSKLFNKSVSEKGTKVLSDEEKLKGYIEHLTPLLFQSWLEVAPLKNEEVLNTDMAHTLKEIIEIFECLWKLCELQSKKANSDDILIWFRTQYYGEFKNNVFYKFPFQQMEGVKKDFKRKSNNQSSEKEIVEAGGQFCLFQNFGIVHLYCALASEKIQFEHDKVHVILDFLINVLSKLRQFTPEELICAEKVLKMVLLIKSEYFMKADSNKSRTLLRTVLKSMNTNNHSLKEYKNKVMVIICDIISNDNLYMMYGPSEFEDWISLLSRIFYRTQITQNIILTLSKLAKQKNKIFLSALKHDIMHIINNLQNIHVIGCKNDLEGRKLIVNLFFWIDDWSKDEQENICKMIKQHINENELVKYFEFVILKNNL